MEIDSPAYDFIVIGSGAGGGTVAANLAQAGFTVALVEAGKDQSDNFNTQVPVFHGLSTEDENLTWDFFVNHYTSKDRQQEDSKYDKEKGGILYPRAGTLGGCTAHNAMILVYPHNCDWDEIASLTKDETWKSQNMRKYFQRLERCRYGILNTLIRWVNFVGISINPRKRGYRGWLQSSIANPTILLKDKSLLRIVYEALEQAVEEGVGNLFRNVDTGFDPNDWDMVKTNAEGVAIFPIATMNGKRNGTREFIKSVKEKFPDNLEIYTDMLATRIIIDENKTAIGIEYLKGQNLYAADPLTKIGVNQGTLGKIFAKKEVIVSGGAFNTPQLLKLSGIGPREELERHQIDVIVDLPGVGENLQDRYEVGVVSKMRKDFPLLRAAQFKASDDDPDFKEWKSGKGVYTSNGGVIGIIKRSDQTKEEPDLYIFGLAGYFKGYFRGYSTQHIKDKDYFTWAVLKGHTRNKAGKVLLKSNDPRDTPDINFHYFDDVNGEEIWKDDLEAVLNGVKFVRRMNSDSGLNNIIEQETVPGKEVNSDALLRTFIMKEAWGHHASCTCKIGALNDPMTVLDSNFKVRGVNNLRVVDASAFPSIPGLFIVSAVYMIGEKASEVIIKDYGKG